MSLTRLWAVTRKELIQLKRDARSLYLAFILPIVLLLLFGYAISFDIRNIEMGVLDESRTPDSRLLVEAFEASGYFTVVRRLERYGAVAAELGAGSVRLERDARVPYASFLVVE